MRYFANESKQIASNGVITNRKLKAKKCKFQELLQMGKLFFSCKTDVEI